MRKKTAHCTYMDSYSLALVRLPLRLHYVPGDHGSHGSPKRSAPCDLDIFLSWNSSSVKYHYVPSRAIKVSVTNRGLNPRRHDGALR